MQCAPRAIDDDTDRVGSYLRQHCDRMRLATSMRPVVGQLRRVEVGRWRMAVMDKERLQAASSRAEGEELDRLDESESRAPDPAKPANGASEFWGKWR